MLLFYCYAKKITLKITYIEGLKGTSKECHDPAGVGIAVIYNVQKCIRKNKKREKKNAKKIYTTTYKKKEKKNTYKPQFIHL